MMHLPYEDWLFEAPQDLDARQSADLEAHLLVCAACHDLADSLGQVERRLRSETMIAPALGFAQRFQTRLEAERRKAHRRQTIVTLGLALGGLLVLVLALLLLAWPWMGALDAMLWARGFEWFKTFTMFQGVGLFVTTLLRAMFEALPLIMWILALGFLSELSVLWVVSYRLLTNPRRVTQ